MTATKFYGKYRGRVLQNIDPLFQGRLMAQVPAMPGATLNWALPCVPYAGPGVGFYAIPPVGANVWIEFEAGNPDYPIWTGCFWGSGELPVGPQSQALLPEIKLFKTESCSLALNDLPTGGVSLSWSSLSSGAPLALAFAERGVTLSSSNAAIELSDQALTLRAAPSTVSITPEVIELKNGSTTVDLTSDLLHLGAAQSSIEINSNGISTNSVPVHVP